MAIEIGALRALLTLDSASFVRGAKRAETSLGRVQQRLRKASAAASKFGRSMSRRMTVPIVAGAAVAVRSSLKVVDAQAKMAQSMGTSTKSLQVLGRAADMAGISQGDLEGSMRRLTRRASLAAQGIGPGAKAFDRLGLAAADLNDLHMDERIKLIQERISELVPTAEQAGVASQIFGDKTGLAMLRLDAATIDKATSEIARFGVAVTDVEADRIEEANDAISALGLVTRGLSNQIAVALAPTLTAIAEKIADLGEWFSALSPKTQRFIGISAALAAAVGPLAIGLGFMAAGLAALASPIGLVVLGFGAIAGAAVYVAAKWDDLTARFPALADLSKRVGENFGEAWEASSNRLDGFVKSVDGAATAIGALFSGDLEGAARGFAEVFQGVTESMVAKIESWKVSVRTVAPEFSAMVGDIITNLSELPHRLWNKGKEAIEAFVSGMLSAWAELKGTVREIFGFDKDIQTELRERYTQIGRDAVIGSGIGIQSGAAEAGALAAETMEYITQQAKDAAQIKSPSRVWMELGKDLVHGLSIGIADNAMDASNAAADAMRQVTDAVAGRMDGVGGAADQFGTSLSAKISSISDEMGRVAIGARKMGDVLRDTFKRSAAALVSSGLKTGLQRVVDLLDLGGVLGGSKGSGGGLLSGIGKLFGFAEGGYTGHGGKYQPAGIVHAGEYVMSAAATSRIGVGNLEAMHQGALRGYAAGGLVTPAPIPVPVAPTSTSTSARSEVLVRLGVPQGVTIEESRQIAGDVAVTVVGEYDRGLDGRVNEITTRGDTRLR